MAVQPTPSPAVAPAVPTVSQGALLVPAGFRAAPGTAAEPYTSTGYAKEVIHEKTGVEMVFIPAGEFMMGSPETEKWRAPDEGPQHRVRITKPFYLGKYEVTVGQFRKFVDETGFRTGPETSGGATVWDGKKEHDWGKKTDANWRSPQIPQEDDCPVVCVSWNDANKFSEWIGGSLPTEAEWEYACRAGSTGRFWWGESETDAGRYANVADKTARAALGEYPLFDTDDGYAYTAPVGKYRANNFGLYDMIGNVWEWCADLYDEKCYSHPAGDDPKGPLAGPYRLLRGGAWTDSPWGSRSARRHRAAPVDAFYSVGFRVAFSVEGVLNQAAPSVAVTPAPPAREPKSTGSVLSTTDGKVKVDLGSIDGLKVGGSVRITLKNAPITDRSTGRTLGYKRPLFKVESLEPDSAIVVPEDPLSELPAAGYLVEITVGAK